MKESHEEANEAFVRVSLGNVLRSFYHSGALQEEYTDMEVRLYQEGSSTHVTVLVAFLQEHETPLPDLEKTVLDALVAETKLMEFSGLVDDISVNALQWRRGTVTQRRLTEEGSFEE